ncbi:SMP-30/gluconolactonase/LRE family protein [Streptomyces sp. NPDC090080]|uniref:SMP-30/gluconolactonase/LRE family protein n=1 Tax=Streptomyces sp. NPDC090080 TaxID=3365939 RepID=UPI0037FA6604
MGAVAALVATSPSAFATTPLVQSPQATNPRVLVHYDLSAGQQPENVALTPDGHLDVVLARAAQIEQVSPSGARRVLGKLPQPADGGVNTPALGFSLATGIVRTDDGTVYVGYAAGDDSLTGIWRLRPGTKPKRVVALSAASFPNGMALDKTTGLLYFADSTVGAIWRVPISGGKPQKWASGSAFEPRQLLGVNGVKVHNGAIWVSNSDQAVLLRVPIRRDGSAGPAEKRASGLQFLDDFSFVGRSDEIIGALNQTSQVVQIHSDGSHETLLTEKDGLEGPTSVALRGGRLYVLSAAYVQSKDPNILVARYRHGSE